MDIFNRKPTYYVGDELHEAKQHKIQEAIKKYELEGILMLKAEAVRYITDFYVKGYRPFFEPEYFVFVPKNKKPIVGYTSGSDVYRIKLKSDIDDTRKLPDFKKWSYEIIQVLKDYGVTSGKIGVDLLPYYFKEIIGKELPNIEFIDVSDIWIELTVVKHPVEIEILKRAVEITEIGFHAAFEAIKPGVKEYEVAAYAEYKMRLAGSEMTPFITNIASGENCAIFERISTDKTIRDGEMVILDMGCVWKGYTGDLGRTVCTGKPTALQKEMYKANHLALHEAIKAIKPGVTCGDIDAVARKVIKDAGFEKYEHKFSTGHQLGYGLHGAPAINRNVDFVLQPGMVMALEPRITMFDRPDVGGTHIEDNVIVTENGCEKISKLCYDENLLS